MTDSQARKAFFSSKIHELMDSLHAVAMRFTRHSADAEDLVADTVEKAWRALDTLEDDARFRPWIFRILHNRFVSDYRRAGARPEETAFDDLLDADDDGEVAALLVRQPDDFLLWWANPERAVMNALLARDLDAAIASLPEAYRTVVVLINIEGLGYDEAAQVLGVSPGTIRSRMNRGRTLLQKALWQHAREAGLLPAPPDTDRAA